MQPEGRWIYGFHTAKADKAFRIRGGKPMRTLAEYPPTLFPMPIDEAAAIVAERDATYTIPTPDGDVEVKGRVATANVFRAGRLIESFRGAIRNELLDGKLPRGPEWIADKASGLWTLADVGAAFREPRSVSADALREAMERGDVAEVARLTGIVVK